VVLRATADAADRPPQVAADERLEGASEAFERPRFYRLYRRWLKEGDSALDSASSTVISDALASGAGRIESIVLPHRYDHLSPLVDLEEQPRTESSRPTRNGASTTSRLA
jgi:hypothetical protein